MAQEIQCGVENCGNLPVYEVILYDVYLNTGEVFYEQDITCPYLCSKHMIDNEQLARSMEITREEYPIRRPRGFVHYPHTNKNRAQGFTIYRPIEQQKTRLMPGVM